MVRTFNTNKIRFLSAFFSLFLLSLYAEGMPKKEPFTEESDLKTKPESPPSATKPPSTPLHDTKEKKREGEKASASAQKNPPEVLRHFLVGSHDKDPFDFLTTLYTAEPKQGDLADTSLNPEMPRLIEKISENPQIRKQYIQAFLEILSMPVFSPALYIPDLKSEFPNMGQATRVAIFRAYSSVKSSTRQYHENMEQLAQVDSPLARTQKSLSAIRPLEKRIVSEDLLLASCQLRAYAIHQPGNFLYLGRSPVLLELISTLLDKKYGRISPNSTQLNFSGSPDMLSRRQDPLYAHPKSYLRDMVTSKRLHAFFEEMDRKNLHNWTGRTYLVDIIGSGSGLVGFCRIWEAYFTHHKKQSPPLHFLFLFSWSLIDELKTPYWTFSPKDHRLHVKSDLDRGIPSLTIPADSIPINDTTRDRTLDDDLTQRLFSSGMKYTACEWGEIPPQPAPFHEHMKPFLEKLFTDLIQKKRKKLDPLFTSK